MILNTESPDTRPIAYFDFDGTLTTGDTLMPFLKYVVGAPAYYANLATISPILIAYVTKLLLNDTAKQIVLKQYLAGYHIDELFEYGQRFSEEVIPSMLRPEGMERLRWHQAQKHECVLVSASMNFYLDPWAKREQLSHVICTTLEKEDSGYVSGKISNQNCHGQEKKKRIIEWQANKNPLETYAYGDTIGDLPMLNLVRHGRMWCNKKNLFTPAQPKIRI